MISDADVSGTGTTKIPKCKYFKELHFERYCVWEGNMFELSPTNENTVSNIAFRNVAIGIGFIVAAVNFTLTTTTYIHL